MICTELYFPENFFMIGVNYKNTDAATRGLFAISGTQYEDILKLAPSFNINEIFVLSTCNRTEVYAFAKDASRLVELLASQTTGNIELLIKMAYIKNGLAAIDHLYHVGTGLDSQILGDYEIVSQLKQAVQFSRDRKFMGTFLERLVSSVLKSSKKIKTDTLLSSGAVSVSFSAVKYIKEKTNFTHNSKVLVVGAGKIGRNTCKNLVDYFRTKNITVVNRSEQKAIEVASELNLQHAPLSDLKHQLATSDIIVIATNATEPLISKSDLTGKRKKLIIDLSIPCNVDDSVKELSNITLIHVDQISKVKDENLKKREAEIPKAKEIIREHEDEFIQWHEMRKNVPVLKAIKSKLKELHTLPDTATRNVVSSFDAELKIQIVINGMANKLLKSQRRGCHYIEAINEFMVSVAS